MQTNPARSVLLRRLFGGFGLLLLSSATASAQVNVSVSGGYAGSMTEEGIKGFSETEFSKNARTYGGGGGFRFRSGITIEARVEQLRLELTETGDVFGTLELRPITVSVGTQSLPAGNHGLAFHGQLGGGIARTKFVTGPWISELEEYYYSLLQVEVTTKNAFVFTAGGGLDYFVTRNFALTSDFRIVGTNVGTSWSVSGPGVSLPIEDADTFYASTVQVLGGVRIWFR